LSSITKNKVIDGPYKGTIISPKKNGVAHIFGLYERQIQEKIVNLQKKYQFKNIINFGAGEGFHIVSLIKKKYFKKGLAFELNDHIRETLIKNIRLNKIEKKIEVFAKADFNDLKKIKDIEKSLYLIDIEGDEFFFFNKENIKFFKRSALIIENHKNLIYKLKLKNKTISAKNVINFYKIINKNFNIEIIKNSERNPFLIKALDNIDDDTRWLAMSEQRPLNMEWLLLLPKK
jgi:tRNA G37 N-methylase Trm5